LNLPDSNLVAAMASFLLTRFQKSCNLDRNWHNYN
jgi:hypothetical protein